MKRQFALPAIWTVAWAACCFPAMADSQNEAFDILRLERQILVPASNDAMQLEVLGDGRVLFIERSGAIKLFNPTRRDVKLIGRIDAPVVAEVGLLGLACDLTFDETGWIYLVYSPREPEKTMRLSRFTIRNDQLDPASEIRLIEYNYDMPFANHMGGGLDMDSRGNLHMGTGDNCPPFPELPVDRRPGHSDFDAMRSAANSQDLRGKVLRIHPEQDGTYTIPEGNLFNDPKQGRPEIFTMGCRNPFRLSVDDRTGVVYWGDVGPNIQMDLGLGPNGYDEINRAPRAGNFGWPLFVGPNEAYRLFDFETRRPGRLFDVNNPVNDSPNNTGLRQLPPPVPAFLWYPSGNSDVFPSMGNGARSAMAGPVYHADGYQHSSLRLPSRYDGRLFIYEWARNWIQTVTMNANGDIESLEPFMSDTVFRKPIDMEIGPDGTLYLIEFGDKWTDNVDSQIVRIVYRRGNREPRAIVSAEPTAGRHPLTVRLSGEDSSDLDHDTLNYQWKVNGEPISESSAVAELTFNEPGRFAVSLTVTDPSGASSRTNTDIRVGNAPPNIEFTSPRHGSFIDWGDSVRYRVDVSDREDGSTADGGIPSRRVLLNRRLQTRRYSVQTDAAGRPLDDGIADPGLALMRNTTCFSCHTTKSKSGGPPYAEVGRKYETDPAARERLAQKIVAGGAGVWGIKPMPPHPQHSVEQTRLMVDWILSLAQDDSSAPVAGAAGFFRADRSTSLAKADSGIFVLTAEYTDNGVGNISGVPPIRSEAEGVLHVRRKRAGYFDRRQGAELLDVFEHGAGLVARFAPGDWITFEDVRLADIDRVVWNAAAMKNTSGTLSLRIDTPDGPELAAIELQGDGDERGDVYEEVTTPIRDPGGLHDLYVVAQSDASTPVDGTARQKYISLAWLDFLDSAEAVRRKAAEEAAMKRIVLIPTKHDHAWSTHMYTEVCELLAATLNRAPNVEAVVSPGLDWPSDERLLKDADAIVYYSRPAGDIVLSPKHSRQFKELMDRGVGFTAIHWATAADEKVGSDYEAILGGWFNFAFSGLNVSRQLLRQVQPDHPICYGWKPYDLRDEFYLNLKFSPHAQPVLQVTVDGRDQTVAWINERADGGRSFGTTLGHFHENYSLPEFRRMLANGILWTVNADVPKTGASVDIDEVLLQLDEPPRALVKEWTLDDLLPILDEPSTAHTFAKGERLFKAASCAACHKMGDSGGTLGPNLADVRKRMAERPNPRAALLRELVEPSHSVDEKFRTTLLVLSSGQVISGIVLSETEDELRLAANPANPEEVLKIRVDDIEDRVFSKVSMMPAGLLNTLPKDAILELLAYVESGGNPDDRLYVTPRADSQDTR